MPLLFFALSCSGLAQADSVTVGDVRHEGIFVRTTERMVYLHFPEDGRVVAHPRSEVSAIELTPEEEERAALEAQWSMAYDARAVTRSAAAEASPLPESHAQRLSPTRAAPIARDDPEPTPSGGIVPRIEVHDVPLRSALTAMLRPMNLDYAVRDGMLFISDPETLRTEPWEPLEVRVYTLKQFDAALPKIVVQNPGGPRTGPLVAR